MNLNKHLEFFDPINTIKAPIHIIGCGAIGSTVAEMLTRMGISELYLYDFDVVSPHNIANQMFYQCDITHLKLDAIQNILVSINPDIKLNLYKKGYTNQPLSGYVFLCVDNIDLRKEIAEENKYNPNIKAMFDFRMRLTDAQHYAADWSNKDSIDAFIKTMQFTRDEAKEATPINACGSTLNIIPTVRTIVSLGLGNFINFIKNNKLKRMILADSFSFIVDAF